MEHGTERDLVRRMLGGDEGAFDEFYADYFPRLFRFAVLRLRDPDAAEDLVQNSLIAGVRNLGSWRGEATLFTWLCTICRREIAAWEKRTSRRVTVLLAEDDPGVRAALESIGAAAEAPDAGLARADTGRIVQLKAHDAPEVESLLGHLRKAGVTVEDLEIGRADLEDVFLEIMQGAHA